MGHLYSRIAEQFRRAPLPIRQFGITAWRLAVRGSLERAVHSSFSEGRICKLHIGAGPHLLQGWFNTDYKPSFSPLYFLDATKRFPFRDNELDYIFSEHVIEHIPFEDGMRMLAECFRTLRPGGKIRLATPDMERILSLYWDHGADQRKYTQWAIEFSKLPRLPRPECFVVNNVMHAWGHCFIYDQPTLCDSILRAGFVKVRRFPVGQSDDPNLTGIESHQKSSGESANSFETMILQAEKP